jgi:hypothetical protein
MNIKKLALTGGIYFAVCFALCTLLSMFTVPGFPEFTNVLESIYGFYGYHASWTGILIGAFWGFIEGFFHFGAFALLYNWLNKK